jgi:hypothetical protein
MTGAGGGGQTAKRGKGGRPKSGKQDMPEQMNPREEQVIRDLKTLIFKVEQLLRSLFFFSLLSQK